MVAPWRRPPCQVHRDRRAVVRRGNYGCAGAPIRRAFLMWPKRKSA
jgi:hypothetical protein